jgi:ATP-binding cassette subfamily B protein
MTRITSDVDVLNELFSSGVVTIVGDVVTLIGIMVAIALMNSELSVVAFSVLPLIFIVTLVFRARVRQTYRDVRTGAGAHEREPAGEPDRHDDRARHEPRGPPVRGLRRRTPGTATRTCAASSTTRSSFPAVELIAASRPRSSCGTAAARSCGRSPTSARWSAFSMYAKRFFGPIQDMTEKYNILQSRWRRPSASSPARRRDRGPASRPAAAGRSRCRGEIVFDHVHFAYQTGEEVLKDVSFRVAPGEKVAIVGATGAGKTTIISLLTRFYDVTQGAIRVDGLDVREWDEAALRRSIGVVLQDVFLFSGNGRGEPAPGRRHPARAARGGRARGPLPTASSRGSPAGWMPRSRSVARTFSTGEKQLLAFARALAFDPGSWCSTRRPRASTPTPSC